MPLFEVNPTSREVTGVTASTFPQLKLWERQDLEAWVTSAPALAGGDFTVVTSEFDRFDRTSERLDVLGITAIEPGRGRLVVVELKRDGTSTTVDLQAIKYAAYVAAAQLDDVVEMHARYHDISAEESRSLLVALLGGSEEEPPVIDDTPRIVLVAGDFRPEVTTTVLWLVDNYEMDVRCVRLQPFAVGDRILVHSETIIPLPEAEQYRLGVLRKRKETEREHRERTRAGRLIPRLLEAEAIEIGQALYFRRDAVPAGGPAWSEDSTLYRAALVTGEGNSNLEWTDPDTGDLTLGSPSFLAATILTRLGLRPGPVSSDGVNGMTYWTIEGETSLRDLAADAGILDGGGSGRRIDREALRQLCEGVPLGQWTTYGDLAAAIGVPGAAQSVARVIATDPTIPNAHRVLRSTGQISPGWTAEEGGPEVARQRLADEGVSFGDGEAAPPALRWTPPAAVPPTA
ncbi:MAG: MGMT family protein [Microbacteriaceae bacterium]